jgi:Asp-tRNA(Asn)/Glu-tRNA(Gln) amidotransferase A subunit family amidase
MNTAVASRRVDRGLTRLPAAELARLTREGRVKAEEVTQAHLAAIEDREPDVQAFAHLVPDFALDQARALDGRRAAGLPVGPLYGVPVAVKDIIDVRGLPCENGTLLDSGRRPKADATVVARLREAGAVIVGKTVTTELAVYSPGKTRNPHDPERSPGGSSSGSAAAVAANMAPLALGTQTNGSVIRPAAYCGVVGYKPSRGLVSRTGILVQSPTLDCVGVFARTIEDAALLTDVLAVFDARDQAMRPGGPADLARLAAEAPPVRPRLALVRSPVWEQADDDTQAAFAEIKEALGEAADDVQLPEPFDRAHALHETIVLADIARHFARYCEHGRDRLSERLRGMIEKGQEILAVDYTLAQDWIEVLNAALETIFERYDAIVTPAATGEAPLGLGSTGSPVFSTIWTYCGTPAVTLPLLTGSHGMPMGVQLVGRRFYDGRLLRTARWLANAISIEGDGGREREGS